MPLEVTLIDHARDPLQKLYGAYRTCYTPKTPGEVWGEIGDGSISQDEDPRVHRRAAQDRPRLAARAGGVLVRDLRGLARALAPVRAPPHRHQLRAAVAALRPLPEERLDYVMPKTWEKVHGMADEYDRLMREITRVYELALEKGIPAEDARFVLPNATPTNFQVMVNFAELLHIADLRLCWRAQWEIRHMVALMRREVVKAIPEIGGYLQPKCGDKRMGYCDEPREGLGAVPARQGPAAQGAAPLGVQRVPRRQPRAARRGAPPRGRGRRQRGLTGPRAGAAGDRMGRRGAGAG